ncbi:MAG TPA: S1/P1 nuclease [Candidatus Limnocylindrales bacterium]|nr:S1/P1 nuclease [Candidatus Limnocylindrales bacterium]
MRKLALFLLIGSTCAFGWGNEGHALVARIAWAEMTPEAKAQVEAILGPGVSMESIASWADDVRRARPESGSWHFVDIPIDKPHMDMARDCKDGACIVAAIARFRAVLSDPNADAVKRKEALMFLVHFVGDMHQPLHCSNHDDKGGNGVRVVLYDKPGNLHSAWDSGFLAKMGPADQLYPGMLKEAEKHRKKWSKGNVEKWAEESHKLAVKITYGKLPAAGAADAPRTLGAIYEQQADPVIREQIEKAGDRLAKFLDDTLQGHLATN